MGGNGTRMYIQRVLDAMDPYIGTVSSADVRATDLAAAYRGLENGTQQSASRKEAAQGPRYLDGGQMRQLGQHALPGSAHPGAPRPRQRAGDAQHGLEQEDGERDADNGRLREFEASYADPEARLSARCVPRGYSTLRPTYCACPAWLIAVIDLCDQRAVLMLVDSDQQSIAAERVPPLAKESGRQGSQDCPLVVIEVEVRTRNLGRTVGDAHLVPEFASDGSRRLLALRGGEAGCLLRSDRGSP